MAVLDGAKGHPTPFGGGGKGPGPFDGKTPPTVINGIVQMTELAWTTTDLASASWSVTSLGSVTWGVTSLDEEAWTA